MNKEEVPKTNTKKYVQVYENSPESRTKCNEGLHVGAVIAKNILPCQQRELIFTHLDLKREVHHLNRKCITYVSPYIATF